MAVADLSACLTTVDMMSSDVEMMKLSSDKETDVATSESVEQIQTEEQSTLPGQSVTSQETSSDMVVEQSPQTTGTFVAKQEEEELEDQRTSILSGQSQVVSTCHGGETGDQMRASSTSMGDFDTADSPSDESGGMTLLPSQQPETPTTLNELITSPEPEMAINSDEVIASSEEQQVPATSTAKEHISTFSAAEAENEQQEARDQVDSKSELQSSLLDQSAPRHDAPDSEQLPGRDESSAVKEVTKDEGFGGAEQPVETRLDATLDASEPQNDDGKLTSTKSSNTLESCSEAVTGEKATHVEEDQLRGGSTDSTSVNQRGWCGELSPTTAPLSNQELRSSVLSQRSETETEIHSLSKTNIERCTFTFPSPPQQPYQPLTLGDDNTDDVFVEHSAPQNDTTASEEILAMTSSTATAADDAIDLCRQQQTSASELVPADTSPVAAQPCRHAELIQDQPPTPCGQTDEARLQPTPEAAAAAATAPSPAEDGDRPAEKLRDEIRADGLHVEQADPTVDNLKTSLSEVHPSIGDFETATQLTDEVRQQLDQVLEQEQRRQPIVGAADRRQLSLLIPTHDSDSLANDNQVSVYTQSLKTVERR